MESFLDETEIVKEEAPVVFQDKEFDQHLDSLARRYEQSIWKVVDARMTIHHSAECMSAKLFELYVETCQTNYQLIKNGIKETGLKLNLNESAEKLIRYAMENAKVRLR